MRVETKHRGRATVKGSAGTTSSPVSNDSDSPGTVAPDTKSVVSGHSVVDRPMLTPAEELLLAEVADLYYRQDQTQEQIARRLGVSRSNVSRLLKDAREHGVVEIRVRHPLPIATDLARDVRERFGLRNCLVLAASHDNHLTFPTSEPDDGLSSPGAAEVSRKLGALAARYLDEQLTDGATVGVGWGSTVYQVVTSGYLSPRPGMTVVQLMGSIGGATPDIDGAQVAGRLGRTLGGRVYYLHAPMVVADAATRNGILRDPHIRRTLDVARRADVLVFSVGAISPQSGIYRAGYLNDADLDYIRGEGAVGDLCGVYYARDGRMLPLEISERTIAVSGDVMRQAPIRVGVSWGAQKALANLGAVRSGLINVLVTDEIAAREMVRLMDDVAPTAIT